MESRIKKLEEILRNDRFAETNQIKLVSIGKGEAIAEMEVAENHLNGVNIIQGGGIVYTCRFCFCRCIELSWQNCRSIQCQYQFL